ncbi:MAG: hypothetical protein KC415_03190 [Anaerolineales bacterium]|nr:hypothetical protein [Anaerolineales bacterium]MCB8990798.1 hypothetical protein [Ardenticatenaceae bacterium]
MIAETIIPWVLGTLLFLTLLMLISSITSWRDMKQSPYFFMRRQAEKRLQTYSSISLVLMFLTVAVVAYGWQPTQTAPPRVALLPNTKPPQEDVVALLENRPTAVVEVETAVSDAIPVAEALRLDGGNAAQLGPALPTEYDQFSPTADLNPDTALGSIAFSTEVTDSYEPLSPAKIFPEGYYTLFATFTYEAMSDGMEWAWVWRHNGQVVDGGNELWQYGDDGPGYIYFGPEEGFQRGEYSLEVWVNGELMTASTATMNTAAVSAGN